MATPNALQATREPDTMPSNDTFLRDHLAQLEALQVDLDAQYGLAEKARRKGRREIGRIRARLGLPKQKVE
mgnify:FL=1